MQVGAANSGYQIIANANQQVSESAQTLAEVAAKREPQQNEVVDALVSLSQAELYAKAGAKVIQTESKMLGTLLDIEA
ncbi:MULTISPECIES: flagellar biosynthesis protein FlgE [unclassified Agarivorans]|uniref:flagellar biosynthesis protein FlgE n=1 Tax=unclassified Agarivorans TaxID=2636026 RepID=UPI0010DAECEB|nr:MULTISPECIES: flagellar biosynthesis protein FlgE [unclassified Agarivorans]MDO6687463.1 hypothetical protein [Agarivorans sp. 3_MG-2023]MDO6715229.1 hypothetical protein [Agarivorans sp. 2_MG-2023]MDO6763474.1 hypothetical protein [Agarivorans sp. 1_MG-2023]GDY27263.1 hypothetical protein AHAT_31530 [Agarivorans sp. Toyoura001]